MGILAGKKVLVTGVLSNRSIAYGIARAAKREGAELAFTYVGERFKERVGRARGRLRIGTRPAVRRRERCGDLRDVESLRSHWDGLDGLVHAIAFAPRESDRRRAARRIVARGIPPGARHLGVQLPGLAKAALPMLEGRQASLLTLTYLGAERAIRTTTRWAWRRRASRRACAISPRTSGRRESASTRFRPGRSARSRQAASPGSARMLKHVEEHAPLRRNVTIDDVGNAAVFLLSPLASGNHRRGDARGLGLQRRIGDAQGRHGRRLTPTSSPGSRG
jgi:enoyl-[acyl-carrier protein] reductase I